VSEHPTPPRRRGWRDPLLHYLVLGAIVFGAYKGAEAAGWVGTPETDATETIVVGPEVMSSLADQFEARYERAWNEEERELAIAAWVDDEILYRSGRADGLHTEDPVVRRRVIQHMRFVLENQTPIPEPTTPQLEGYLDENADRYRTGVVLDYREVSIDREAFDDPELTAQSTLAQLESGTAPETLAQTRGIEAGRAEGITLQRAASVRGESYAQFLAEQPLHEWATLELDDRWIVVELQSRTASGTVPPLAQIRDRVAKDWTDARQKAALAQAMTELRNRYDIIER